MEEREQLEWIEMKEERKVLKKFFAGRREELQMSREAISESLGHRLRQPDERGKKVSIIFTIEERGSVDRLTFVVTLGYHGSLLFRSLDLLLCRRDSL
ncbi:hypothetical protein Taro_009167 [Colocasia esculenta]|uniref:Uncharacterized protein n=1 Tax=Colocasia esculenta TaxID=4460 RepID=A0A843U415_COLES|nr:hypothetical protein [Colocasia esculenta]